MNAHFKIATDAINGCKCYAPTDGDDGDGNDGDDGASRPARGGMGDVVGTMAWWPTDGMAAPTWLGRWRGGRRMGWRPDVAGA
jgi:hypothetical protein